MRKLVGWGATALVVIAVAVGVLGTEYGWHWGDVPTWVGAIATVTALEAAGVGAYFAYRQLGALRQQVQVEIDALTLERTRQKEDREEAEKRAKQEIKLLEVAARQQAEQIEVDPGMLAVILPGTEGNPGYLSLGVENRSNRPIRDLNCRAVLDNGNELAPVVAVISIIRPDGKLLETEQALSFPVALMRRNTVFEFVFEAVAKKNKGTKYTLRFTDDADQHWELTGEMRLTRIPDRSDW